MKEKKEKKKEKGKFKVPIELFRLFETVLEGVEWHRNPILLMQNPMETVTKLVERNNKINCISWSEKNMIHIADPFAWFSKDTFREDVHSIFLVDPNIPEENTHIISSHRTPILSYSFNAPYNSSQLMTYDSSGRLNLWKANNRCCNDIKEVRSFDTNCLVAKWLSICQLSIANQMDDGYEHHTLKFTLPNFTPETKAFISVTPSGKVMMYHQLASKEWTYCVYDFKFPVSKADILQTQKQSVLVALVNSISSHHVHVYEFGVGLDVVPVLSLLEYYKLPLGLPEEVIEDVVLEQHVSIIHFVPHSLNSTLLVVSSGYSSIQKFELKDWFGKSGNVIQKWDTGSIIRLSNIYDALYGVSCVSSSPNGERCLLGFTNGHFELRSLRDLSKILDQGDINPNSQDRPLKRRRKIHSTIHSDRRHSPFEKREFQSKTGDQKRGIVGVAYSPNGTCFAVYDTSCRLNIFTVDKIFMNERISTVFRNGLFNRRCLWDVFVMLKLYKNEGKVEKDSLLDVVRNSKNVGARYQEKHFLKVMLIGLLILEERARVVYHSALTYTKRFYQCFSKIIALQDVNRMLQEYNNSCVKPGRKDFAKMWERCSTTQSFQNVSMENVVRVMPCVNWVFFFMLALAKQMHLLHRYLFVSDRYDRPNEFWVIQVLYGDKFLKNLQIVFLYSMIFSISSDKHETEDRKVASKSTTPLDYMPIITKFENFKLFQEMLDQLIRFRVRFIAHKEMKEKKGEKVKKTTTTANMIITFLKKEMGGELIDMKGKWVDQLVKIAGGIEKDWRVNCLRLSDTLPVMVGHLKSTSRRYPVKNERVWNCFDFVTRRTISRKDNPHKVCKICDRVCSLMPNNDWSESWSSCCPLCGGLLKAYFPSQK